MELTLDRFVITVSPHRSVLRYIVTVEIFNSTKARENSENRNVLYTSVLLKPNVLPLCTQWSVNSLWNSIP
jgi:hypothetical protein